MAETTPAKPAATAGTDHDRVVGLSVRKDGSLDQHNPEIIGDRDAAVEATKRQFAQQAVSAVDDAERRKALEDEAADSKQDPTIEARQKKHEAAAKAAEARAEQVVKALS